MCINFPITVRALQNNELGFPLIFTIAVVELLVDNGATLSIISPDMLCSILNDPNPALAQINQPILMADRTLTLQSPTFPFCIVIYHFHLLMMCISKLIRYEKACFAYVNFSKRGHPLTKKLMLKGYNEYRLHFANSTVAIMTLFAITNYH
jgi:hypothetical protein